MNVGFNFFFFTLRYMNHLQSLKFESKLYAMVKEKMEEMQQHNMSWIEVTLHNLFHSTHYTKNKDTRFFSCPELRVAQFMKIT